MMPEQLKLVAAFTAAISWHAMAVYVTSFPHCLFVTLWQVRRAVGGAGRGFHRRLAGTYQHTSSNAW
jgi:hypothetical protein